MPLPDVNVGPLPLEIKKNEDNCCLQCYSIF